MEFFAKFFERESDDVAEGAGDFGHNEFAMILNGIATSFIEGIDFGEVLADLLFGQGMKGDVGADGKKAFAMGTQMEEANPGDHLMGLALELAEHPMRVGEVARFCEDFTSEKHEGVGTKDKRVWNFFGNDSGFAVGVQEANFARGQVVRGHLRGIAGNDTEFGSQLAQQIGTPGRRRSQDQ